MSSSALLASQVLLYATFPFAFAFFARPARLVLFYVYIAVVLVLGGFFGAVYAVEVRAGVTLSAGSVLYGALMLTVFMLVLVGRDARVVRNVIKVVIAVNVFKLATFALAGAALRSRGAANPFGTAPEVFSVSIQLVLVGGLLIVSELVLLVVLFEAAKTHVHGLARLAALYVVLFVGVLCLDGVLFPVLAWPTSPVLGTLIATGVQAKLVLALAYTVPLVLFVVTFRRRLAEGREEPLRLQELFFAPKQELVDEVERQQHALEAGAERYRQLVESSADAIVGASLDGTIVSWNRAAARLYDRAEHEAVGQGIELLLAGVDGAVCPDVLATVGAGERISDVESTVRRRDGSTGHVALTVSPVLDAGRPVGISVIGRDTTERHEMQSALQHQARHDALTGLPNRAVLMSRVERALASTDGAHPVAVMFLDLDQFKVVNDGSGHLAGDRLLVLVAERLQAAVRPGDLVARFGGDEFVVLCEDTDAATATGLAEKLLRALDSPVLLDGQRVYVSASLGVAAGPGDAETLLRHADAAMYAAKARGRGRVQLFDASMATAVEGRLTLGADLRDALARDELELHYQPIVTLRTGRLVSVEALARWRHPVRGWIPPEQFVPLAEEGGFVGDLTRWALRRACRDGARAFEAGVLPPRGRIAVNLSAHDAGDPAVVDLVRDCVEQSGLTYPRLVLEVTESALMADSARSIEVLRALRDLGVTIALDDFGTGYSSLAYLRRFPVGKVKIDRSFTRGIADTPEDRAIVTSVVRLAKAMGMATVAEGVETREQVDLLLDMGCDSGQGFWWSRALPIEELLRAPSAASEQPFPVTGPVAGPVPSVPGGPAPA